MSTSPASSPDPRLHASTAPAADADRAAPGTPQASGPAGGTWHEHLHPAWWWWLVALPLWLTVTLAVWAYLGLGWAVILTLAVALLTGSWIVQLGLHTRGDERGFRAGRNPIEWRWIADATPLDAETARAQVNSSLGHRAFLVTRPYVGSAVLVRLDDPADPHPAWIVATRRPEALAAFINQHVAAARR